MKKTEIHGGRHMWPSLATASHIFDWAGFILIGALMAGAVCTILIVWMGIVKEHHWDQARDKSAERIKELETESLRAKADVETAKADIAKATAISDQANERAAEANQATEELRKENLEMFQAVAPRNLDQSNRVTDPLKPFAGIQAFLLTYPDWEARRFSGYLEFLLGQAGWKTAPLPFGGLSVIQQLIPDGVEIMYLGGFLQDASGQPTMARFNEKGGHAADTLVNELEKQKIAAKADMIFIKYADRMWPAAVPKEALIIKVGIKPQTYFSERDRPELKRAREATEEMMKEGRRFREEMMKQRATPPPR